MSLRNMIAAMAMMHVGAGPVRGSRPFAPPVRPCLLCHRPKRHNNSFCSPECCKAHKAGMRWADVEKAMKEAQDTKGSTP